MVKKLMVWVFGMFVGGIVGAQTTTISGSVHDAVTKEPVPYANVILKNAADSVMNGGISDEDGSFSLQDKTSDVTIIEISGLGYKKQTVPLEITKKSSFDVGEIYLKRDTNLLDEVNVAEQNTVVQKFDRKVYGISENKKSAARDIYDLLRTLPGVSVDEENNIRYKGTSPEVMVDDMPAEYMYPDLAMIPVDNVDKIEIIDASMRSGGEGKGGIINIKMKKPPNDGFSGVGSIRGSTAKFDKLNNKTGYANLNFKTGDVIFYNNLWYYSSNRIYKSRTTGNKLVDDVLYATSGDSQSDSEYNYLNESLGVQWSITDKAKLVISSAVGNGGGDYWSDSESTMMLGDDVYQDYTRMYQSEYKSNYSNVSAYFRHDIDTTLREFTAYVYYSPGLFDDKSTNESNYYYRYLNSQLVNDTLTNLTKTKSNTSGVYSGIYYNHPVSEKTRWNARYRGNISVTNEDETEYYVNGVPVLSQYAGKTGYNTSHSLSVRLGTRWKKWRFDGGIEQNYKKYHEDYAHYTESLEDTTVSVRADYYTVLPSGNLQFTIDSMQDLKISYSRSVKVPYSGYLTGFVKKRNPYSWSTGNPELEPAAYNNVYMGYAYNKPLWNLSADMFFSQTNNEISYINYPVDEVITLRMPENIAYQSRIGIDLSAYAAMFKGKCSLTFSSSFYHSHIDATSLSESMEAQGVPVEEIVKNNYGYDAKIHTSIKIFDNTSGSVDIGYNSREVEFDGYEYPDVDAGLSIVQHLFERSLMISLSGRNLLGNVMKHGGYSEYAGIETERDVYYSLWDYPVFSFSIRYR
ncbi:MAG: TonB-dependent receptor, partial [Bacteroidota bacterium]|nr:TonB-dependent receptor [Bacteroidota bacterium]